MIIPTLTCGVYYVKTPNNCGDIAFEHPVEDKMTIMPSVEGRLYIFPAGYDTELIQT